MERICLDKRQSNTFSNGLEGANGLPHNREGDADADDAGSALGLAIIHINWREIQFGSNMDAFLFHCSS